MKTLAVCALGLSLLAACGDDGGNNSGDGGGDDDTPSDGGGGDDGGPDPQCVPAPLAACAAPRSGTNVVVTPFVGDFGDGPVLVTAPTNDPRQFVVVRNGQIRLIENGTLLTEPFYDLEDDVNANLAAGGEQGLLGLAFHPEYGCNKTFFIFYTRTNANVIARCTASDANANVANPTCTTVLTIDDFAGNHNGGMMEFGRDGFLYIGTGDGGGGGDPQRNSQALVDSEGTRALLGKMLRIDVDQKDPGKEYGIPASNPFAMGGGAPEIFFYGLRNPWRWSFDKATGDLWIGDVGQNWSEELTVLRAGQAIGKNLGWSIWEGNGCCMDQGQGDAVDDEPGNPNNNGCSQSTEQQVCDANVAGLVFPQRTYAHTDGWASIIAGETYRGTCMPDLVGWHFYTDFNSQNEGLKRARLMTGGNVLEVFDYPTNDPQLPNHISSIHADASGEIWMTRTENQTGGGLYRLQLAP